jgi:hypothetical protein
VKTQENPLKKFRTPDDVATAINQMIGVEAISGRELANRVKNGRVGQSPPRRGRKPKISAEEIKMLATTEYSAAAIEQNSADSDRRTRHQWMSAAGRVVNQKLRKDGLQEYFDKNIHEMLLYHNSRKQLLNIVDH